MYQNYNKYRQNTEYGKIIRQKIEGNYSDIQILENRNRNLERMRNIYGCVDRDKRRNMGMGIGGKEMENSCGNGNGRVDNEKRVYSKIKGQ